jgi:hypothetical protein
VFGGSLDCVQAPQEGIFGPDGLEASLVDSDRTREDEWFRKNEKEILEAARVAREKREAERTALEKAEERKRLKELHHMKCPKCGHDMKEEPIDDVLIDRCTFCEGIYLDPGELDKLFLRKAGERKSLLGKLIGI